jgi:hypothetical protein
MVTRDRLARGIADFQDSVRRANASSIFKVFAQSRRTRRRGLSARRHREGKAGGDPVHQGFVRP